MKLKAAHLGEVATIDRQIVGPQEIPDGTPYIGLEHIESGGRILGAATVTSGELSSAKFRFSSAHVLFGKLRPNLAKIALPNLEGICSTDILPIAPGPHLDRRYLAYFLRQPATVSYVSSRATGVNLPRLSPSALADLEIPLPPLEEQRRIAAILDKADALRQKRKQAIESVSQLAESTFRKMFVDEDTASWQEATIEQLATDIRTGPFGSQLLHSEFVDEGIPVLGIDNAVDNSFKWGKSRHITAEKYKKLHRYTVRPGDVLVTIMGTCGRCAVVPYNIPTAINTKHLCCITLNQDSVLPEYVQSCFLFHDSVLSQLGVQAKGAVMPGLNMGIIKGVRIHVPSMDRQKAFVGLLGMIQARKKVFTKSSDKLNALFASLQHRAFSGQL